MIERGKIAQNDPICVAFENSSKYFETLLNKIQNYQFASNNKTPKKYAVPKKY